MKESIVITISFIFLIIVSVSVWGQFKELSFAASDECQDSDAAYGSSIEGIYTSGSVTYDYIDPILGNHEQGQKHDKCISENSVTEFYCGGGVNSGPVQAVTVNCPSYGGKCVNGACTREASCIDTDNGKTYDLKGKVTAGATSQVNYDDVCQTEKILKEQYCEGTEEKEELYTCPGKCVDGKCVQQGYCSDTDDGKNSAVKGTVTASVPDQGEKSFTDYCLGKGESERIFGPNADGLAEYICDKTAPDNLGNVLQKEEHINCIDDRKVCEDGACVEKEKKNNIFGFITPIKIKEKVFDSPVYAGSDDGKEKEGKLIVKKTDGILCKAVVSGKYFVNEEEKPLYVEMEASLVDSYKDLNVLETKKNIECKKQGKVFSCEAKFSNPLTKEIQKIYCHLTIKAFVQEIPVFTIRSISKEVSLTENEN